MYEKADSMTFREHNQRKNHLNEAKKKDNNNPRTNP